MESIQSCSANSSTASVGRSAIKKSVIPLGRE